MTLTYISLKNSKKLASFSKSFYYSTCYYNFSSSFTSVNTSSFFFIFTQITIAIIIRIKATIAPIIIIIKVVELIPSILFYITVPIVDDGGEFYIIFLVNFKFL